MNKIIRIVGVVLIGGLILLEQTLNLNSFIKQGYKIVLLVFIPLLIIYLIKKTTFKKEYHFNNVKLHDLKKPLIVGISIYTLTIIGYIILKSIIDPETVINGLNNRGITAQNIIYTSMYLTFINSFIEEFFFRGFIYQYFSEVSNKVGYFVSSGLFSIYHILVMFAIFNWIMGVLAIIGLMIVGMILVYINKNNKSIVNSWIVHIFADLGVVTIGFYIVLGM